MRKILAVLVIGAMVALAAAPAMAEYVEKQMNNAEYKAFLAKHTGKPKTPPMQKTPAGSRYPGCRVCAATPTCPSGYVQVGYTEVLDFMTVNSWGKPDHGPGGTNVVRSQTIVKDFVTVHDHVKSAICDPAKK